jgi:trans-aconitate 2-methyltransferase
LQRSGEDFPAMSDWSPTHYLKFAGERTRAARDLLVQVPLDAPRTVYDLGCGPGNSTALLVERYPDSDIIGLDNSPAMVEAACKALPAAAFMLADLSAWTPDAVPDLLFSNATFQWLPDHVSVIQRLTQVLEPGGVIALQMPDNLGEPSHRFMAEIAEQGPWHGKLSETSAARDAIPPPQAYYERLKPCFTRLDIWHTIYNHPLQGVDGIVDWLKSTGLRPYLNPLSTDEQVAFLEDYKQRLATAYPATADGTVLLRFPRLFMVGQR